MKPFTSEKINEHITKINTFLNVYCYLVEGEKRACLIDTGYGMGDLRSYVESLTDKPYFVIVSHGHIDHVDGAGLFDEVYMNEKDVPLYENEYSIERRLAYFEEYKSWSDWCRDYKMADFNCYRTKPFLPLHDGDVFDLGNLHLKAVEVPGHTPGMTMILIEEDRIMFYGDGCTKHTYMFTNGGLSISEYLQGLKHLKEYDDAYDTVIRSHNSYTQPKSVLDEAIRLCEAILNHTDAHQATEVVGEKVFSAAEEDENHNRKDGVIGNIYYLNERAH